MYTMVIFIKEAYAETQTEHLPELLRHVTNSLAKHCTHLADAEINTCLQLCTRILSRVLPSMNPVQKQVGLTEREKGQG